MTSMAYAGHFRLYDFVWKDERFMALKPKDKMLFIAIAHQAPRAFPRIDTLAKKIGCHRTTVMRGLKKLADMGFISVFQKKGFVNNYAVQSKFLPASVARKMRDHVAAITSRLGYAYGKAYKFFDALSGRKTNTQVVAKRIHEPNSSINQTNEETTYADFLRRNPDVRPIFGGSLKSMPF